MTTKTIIYENKDFQILRIGCLASMCCGKVPFNSICIKKKGGMQQFNLDEEKFESLKELLAGKEVVAHPA